MKMFSSREMSSSALHNLFLIYWLTITWLLQKQPEKSDPVFPVWTTRPTLPSLENLYKMMKMKENRFDEKSSFGHFNIFT